MHFTAGSPGEIEETVNELAIKGNWRLVTVTAVVYGINSYKEYTAFLERER